MGALSGIAGAISAWPMRARRRQYGWFPKLYLGLMACPLVIVLWLSRIVRQDRESVDQRPIEPIVHTRTTR